MVKSWRTKTQINETLSINRGGRPKITHFWSPNKRAYGKERKRKEKKRKRKEKKRKKEEQRKGMDIWSLSMELYGFWYDFCT